MEGNKKEPDKKPHALHNATLLLQNYFGWRWVDLDVSGSGQAEVVKNEV